MRDQDPFTTPTRQPSTPSILFIRDFAYPDTARVVHTEQPRMSPTRSVSASPARDFARLLSGPTVDIFVGEERKNWTLHRNLLCHHSPYFETELLGHEVPKKQNAEGSNRLDLPDDDPKGFELLVKWLYQGQLDDTTDLSNEDKYEYAVACQKLYLLSNKFSIPHLSNLATDAYRQSLFSAHLVPDADEVNDIYRSSPPGSPFRKLMTKIAARQIMDPEVDKDAESYRSSFEDNPDFAVEMVNAIRSMSGGILFDNPTEGVGCEWHDHSDGSDCKDPVIGTGRSDAKIPQPNGIPAHNRPLQSPTITRVRQTPLAELSTDKRTPRKLNLPPQRGSAKPGAQQRSTSLTHGRAASTPLANATGISPDKSSPEKSSRPGSMSRANGTAKTTPPRSRKDPSRSPAKLQHRSKESMPDDQPRAPANSPSAPGNGHRSPSDSPSTANTPRKVTAKGLPNGRRAVTGPARMNSYTPNEGNESAAIKESNKLANDQNQGRVNGIVKQFSSGKDANNEKGSAQTGSKDGSEAQETNGSISSATDAGDNTSVNGGPRSVAETSSSEGLDSRKSPVKLKRKVPG